MKSKFAGFTDSLFIRLLLFAALFMWAGFYTNAVNAALAAFAGTVSICGLLSVKTRKVRIRPDAEFLETVLLQLTLLPQEEAVALIGRALARKYSPQPSNGGLIVGETFVYPAFLPEPLSASRLTAAVALSPCKRILLLTVNGLSADAEKLNARLDTKIVVKDGVQVYGLLRGAQTFPAITVRPPVHKKRPFSAFRSAFTPDKTRKYLFAAATLFLGAYMLPFGVYYLVAASACLVCAVLCLLAIRHRSPH